MTTKKLLIGIALVSTLAACSSSKVSNDDIKQLDTNNSSSETQTDTQMSESTETTDIDKDLNSLQITDPTQELTTSEK